MVFLLFFLLITSVELILIQPSTNSNDLESSFEFCDWDLNNLEEWDGLYGRMQKHLPVYIGDAGNTNVYICGPPNFVNEIIDLLLYLGFTKEQIKREVW